MNVKQRGLWTDVWNRMRRNKSAVVGMIMLLLILIVVFAAPLFIDYNTAVLTPNYDRILKFPAEGTLLGGDELGRDIFARILYGGKISITLAFVSIAISATIGLGIGCIAGYYGGIVDTLFMRTLDVVMAIPSVLLVITIVTVFKPSLVTLLFALAFSDIPAEARLIRGQVLTVKNQEYIEAIKAQGASDFRVIFGHILPNAISPFISNIMQNVAGAIMQISALSFIGLGVQAPNPEWGAMLASGRAFIRDSFHVTLFPGIAIVLTVVALTLVGDGLRDALDPRMKR
ncbi:MAG: ABC transporter permease [Lachnospiraceae bacterium]